MRSRIPTLALTALVILLAADRLFRRPPAAGAGHVAGATTPRAPLPARTDPAVFGHPADTTLATRAAGVRSQIEAAGTTVYLAAMFGETDSVIRRWSDADADHLRIAFVVEDLPGWTDRDQEIARAALREWEHLGLGVRFDEVLDTTGAQIVVRWLPRFTFDRTGQADLKWDGEGRVRHAMIELALADQDGRPLPADAKRAVALHEVGHALGLPHSDRADDLMYPTTRWPIISARDSATIRLLYRLPPSSIKWPVHSSSP
ncbi:MAG: matrixin family metalloprotease [Gemmatimonadetes bacterium]|nr:matrixin family metalloprotease [Gemmatimonadota bacterium]